MNFTRFQNFLFGAGIGVGVAASFTAHFAGAAMVWILVLLGGLLFCLPGFKDDTLRAIILPTYLSLFCIFWLLSLESSNAINRSILLFSISLGLMLVLSISALIKSPPSRKSVIWLIVLFAAGMLVAEFSGGSGGPGRWVKFFTEVLGWSMEAAETATYAIRKTLHFTFYGVLGVLCSRAMQRSGATEKQACAWAMVWPIAHGTFDELRQYFTPGRQGTWTDLLLDTAGAACLLGLTYWIATRRERRNAA